MSMTMTGSTLLASVVLLGTAAITSAQSDSVTIVQPGAPGASSRNLTREEAIPTPRGPSAADISFMQGMIMHHSQAVEMTDLLRTRGRSKELQELGKRISISQTDEIKFMKGWLVDRNQSTTMDMGDMRGMDHKGHKMDSMALMPGMLSPQPMKELACSSGATFDHVLLCGVIKHETGALIMVEDLCADCAGAQDTLRFQFASETDN